MWNLALPAGLAGMITLPSVWAVNLLVTRVEDGLTLVGVLAVANLIRQAVLQLPILINSVTFTLLGQTKGTGARGEFQSVFRANLLSTIGLGAVLAMLVMLGSEWVLHLWVSATPLAVDVTRVFMLSIIPELIAAAYYQVVQSAGKMWTSLCFIAIPRDFLYVALTAGFVSEYGLISVAYSYLAAQLLSAVCTIGISRTPLIR